MNQKPINLSSQDITQAEIDAVVEVMRSERLSIVPIHTQPYVTEKSGTRAGDFPLTEHLAARTIALPFFARISDQQIGRIKAALVEAIASL